MSRRRKIRCALCHDIEVDTPGEICELCWLTVFQTDEIAEAYSTGKVENQIRNFIPEIEFTFERDLKVSRYFNTAWEIIQKSFTDYMGTPIPQNRIEELKNKNPEEIREIFDILKFANVAHLEGEVVKLDSMAERIVEILPTGEPLASPSVKGIIREMRGSICIALAQPLLDPDRSPRRPRNFLVNFNHLSNVLRHYEPFGRATGLIRKEVHADEFFIPIAAKRFPVQIGQKQMLKILRDHFGWVGEPKIIEAFKSTPSGYIYVLKDVTLTYMERMRERRRERPRER